VPHRAMRELASAGKTLGVVGRRRTGVSSH
jgi:hypothetical protein